MQREEMDLLAVRATLWRMEIEILREIHRYRFHVLGLFPEGKRATKRVAQVREKTTAPSVQRRDQNARPREIGRSQSQGEPCHH